MDPLNKPGYKQTELGWIPEDWVILRFGEICSPSKVKMNPLNSESQKCVELENLSQGTGRILGVSDSKDSLSLKTVFLKGDILLGKLRPYLRKYLFADFEGVCSTEIWALKSNRNIYNRFTFYLAQSDKIIEAANLSTGTKMPRAEWKTVSETLIPLPPTLSEQTAIATALSDMDGYIGSLEKLIAKKRMIKQGAMQELLTPKEDWEVKEIGDLVSITTGSKNAQDKVDDGEYPFFVRSQSIERINSFSFDGEAVLTAGDGVGTGKIFHYIKGKFDLHQRVYKMSDFSENLDGYYFYLYFSENFFDRIMQMTAKSSVDSVRREMISKMVIPYPSLKQQQEISNTLREIDREILSLEKKLLKGKQLKQGMMQELLTGRTRLV